jgi:hypothetical protein
MNAFYKGAVILASKACKKYRVFGTELYSNNHNRCNNVFEVPVNFHLMFMAEKIPA